MKKMLLVMVTMMAVMSGTAKAAAFPDMSTQTVSTGFRLEQGEIETVNLNGWQYVEKIYVQAEGIYNDATFEVMANGQTKGTIYVPGRDPLYVVTIRETISSLQLRHISGGNVRVRSIKVEGGQVHSPVHSLPHAGWNGGLQARNQAMQIANEAIAVSSQFEDQLDFMTYGRYILPIKKAAGRLSAVASARGDLSSKTAAYLATLEAQIQAACQVLDQQLSINNSFDLATQLLTIQEEIKDALN